MKNNYIKSFGNDFASSIVVFLVALPLCLGVALASNAPLFSGIIAGVVGGVVVGIISKSHLSVSGPAAGLTAIVAGAIAIMPGMAPEEKFQAFLIAVVLAGAIQFLLGVFKLGIIGDYVPNSVIKGMLAAIGLILILNQFPHLLGDTSHFETDEAVKTADGGNIFTNFFNAFGSINNVALLIGALCLIFHFIWEKIVGNKKGFIRFIPAPLIIVFMGIGINAYFNGNNPGIALTGEHLVEIPVSSSANEFFSFFMFPKWEHLLNKDVLVTAITLALVASLESLLSIEAVDDLDPYQRVTPTNRELKAQGAGNMISGLIGGLPVTSVIVRSSANVNAGAKTKMSTILHGLLLLLCVAFIPVLLNLIPKTALAAVLIFTGYKLAKPSLFVYYYKKGWDQFLPFVITIGAILATDLLKGVIIGIGVGLFFAFRSNFRKSVFVVHDEDKYLIRLRKDVSFLNKGIIKNKLQLVPENGSVVIDAVRADYIDRDVIETIEDFIISAPLKKIDVELLVSNMKDQGFSEKIKSKPDGSTLTRKHSKEIVEENFSK